MRKSIYILTFSLFFLLGGTPESMFAQNKLKYNGQVSAWAGLNPGSELPALGGIRYLPKLSYGIGRKDTSYFDFELSANAFANSQFQPFDSFLNSSSIRPYRAWIRYSTAQWEVRAGLQKINFGSASILRPMMWFDQIDPRDPLQLTNGVYGVLGRYYFVNNANIWLWGLYGNEARKGWEQTLTVKKQPEFGGRVQYPVPRGELALTYHHRTAQSLNLPFDSLREAQIPENRIGIDGKWDVGVGLWFEASYISKQKFVGSLTHQGLFNVGIDYTFGLGNGLSVMAEQLTFAYDENAFAFENPSTLTAATVTYPLGFYDNLTGVLYYDWAGQNLFTFVNYSHQFKLISLNVIGYWNPNNTQIIQQDEGANTFSGRGFQVMLVYNH
ncbi:MAG: hypothetical protein AB8H47_05585 [Bacteroidia bacterium]